MVNLPPSLKNGQRISPSIVFPVLAFIVLLQKLCLQWIMSTKSRITLLMNMYSFSGLFATSSTTAAISLCALVVCSAVNPLSWSGHRISYSPHQIPDGLYLFPSLCIRKCHVPSELLSGHRLRQRSFYYSFQFLSLTVHRYKLRQSSYMKLILAFNAMFILLYSSVFLLLRQQVFRNTEQSAMIIIHMSVDLQCLKDFIKAVLYMESVHRSNVLYLLRS